MKKINQIVVTIAIATVAFTTIGCSSTKSGRKASAQPQARKAPPVQPQQMPVAVPDVAQLAASIAQFEEVSKDAAGNMVTNNLTTHFVTEPFKKRELQFSQAAIQPFLNQLGTIQLSASSVVNIMETRKNLAIVADKLYKISPDELEKLLEVHAPLLSKRGLAAIQSDGQQQVHAPAPVTNGQGVTARYQAVNDIQPSSGTLQYGVVHQPPQQAQGQPSMQYGTVAQPAYYQGRGHSFVYGRR